MLPRLRCTLRRGREAAAMTSHPSDDRHSLDEALFAGGEFRLPDSRGASEDTALGTILALEAASHSRDGESTDPPPDFFPGVDEPPAPPPPPELPPEGYLYPEMPPVEPAVAPPPDEPEPVECICP